MADYMVIFCAHHSQWETCFIEESIVCDECNHSYMFPEYLVHVYRKIRWFLWRREFWNYKYLIEIITIKPMKVKTCQYCSHIFRPKAQSWVAEKP